MSASKRTRAEPATQVSDVISGDGQVFKRARGENTEGLDLPDKSQAYINALNEIQDEIKFAMKSIQRAAGDETCSDSPVVDRVLMSSKVDACQYCGTCEFCYWGDFSSIFDFERKLCGARISYSRVWTQGV